MAEAGPLDELAHAHGGPVGTGHLRSRPEDFEVEEILGFEPDGEGQHRLLWVQKRDTNTDWLAGRLARFAGVKRRDVGYAGLKDRHAVTRQWFSVDLAGSDEPDWSALDIEGVTVLRAERHRRKLRRGTLQGNRFRIVIRELEAEPARLEARLDAVRRLGVPNYFGEQRFGRNGANLQTAKAMFGGRKIRDRHARSLCLSAARSWLFNDILNVRVERGDWNRPLAGDVMMLAGTRSHFLAGETDAGLERRVHEFDIHPTGPLWGRGELPTRSEAAALEAELPRRHPLFCQGLERAGLEQERRALRLPVPDLAWTLDTEAGTLTLEFTLPAGAYATTVLREIVDCSE
ncbi:MAG TPA: tRNA pseudouridine(13) synthase TruD [Thiotrichales bacterium]|nr:tRNA pseudouridine(13) synthase TruD [Thiotrichales bacterium]